MTHNHFNTAVWLSELCPVDPVKLKQTLRQFLETLLKKAQKWVVQIVLVGEAGLILPNCGLVFITTWQMRCLYQENDFPKFQNL